MKRVAALALAYFFLALAMIGVFLPLVPTVPFLLLAAWFSARGSERLRAWLYAHPSFGKLLRDWDREGAISRRSKISSLVMMTISWFILFFLDRGVVVLTVLAAVFFAVSVYIVTRPEPSA